MPRLADRGGWPANKRDSTPAQAVLRPMRQGGKAMNSNGNDAPYAYAIENDQGFIVGCWKSLDIATSVLMKGQKSHGEFIVPLYTAQAGSDATEGEQSR